MGDAFESFKMFGACGIVVSTVADMEVVDMPLATDDLMPESVFVEVYRDRLI